MRGQSPLRARFVFPFAGDADVVPGLMPGFGMVHLRADEDRGGVDRFVSINLPTGTIGPGAAPPPRAYAEEVLRQSRALSVRAAGRPDRPVIVTVEPRRFEGGSHALALILADWSELLGFPPEVEDRFIASGALSLRGSGEVPAVGRIEEKLERIAALPDDAFGRGSVLLLPSANLDSMRVAALLASIAGRGVRIATIRHVREIAWFWPGLREDPRVTRPDFPFDAGGFVAPDRDSVPATRTPPFQPDQPGRDLLATIGFEPVPHEPEPADGLPPGIGFRGIGQDPWPTGSEAPASFAPPPSAGGRAARLQAGPRLGGPDSLPPGPSPPGPSPTGASPTGSGRAATPVVPTSRNHGQGAAEPGPRRLVLVPAGGGAIAALFLALVVAGAWWGLPAWQRAWQRAWQQGGPAVAAPEAQAGSPTQSRPVISAAEQPQPALAPGAGGTLPPDPGTAPQAQVEVDPSPSPPPPTHSQVRPIPPAQTAGPGTDSSPGSPSPTPVPPTANLEPAAPDESVAQPQADPARPGAMACGSPLPAFEPGLRVSPLSVASRGQVLRQAPLRSRPSADAATLATLEPGARICVAATIVGSTYLLAHGPTGWGFVAFDDVWMN